MENTNERERAANIAEMILFMGSPGWAWLYNPAVSGELAGISREHEAEARSIFQGKQ